jgi:GGDEF domain-containing protein
MMVEPLAPAPASPHAASMERPKSRPRRFTLPAHDDQRVHRVVEGLLSEPRAADHPERGRKRRTTNGDPLSALLPRLDWAAALQREELRRARYERPVGVAVVDLAVARDQRAVRLIAGILRQEARDTDHVTRVGPGRFHVLLPETRERGVRNFIDRVCTAWSVAERQLGTDTALCVGGAGTRAGESIPEALERAIGQLG